MVMYPQRLTEHIMLLGNRYLQTYLILGDKASVLIESGISATAPQLVEQLIASHTDPSSIDFLFLTHAHADHVTGAPVLKSMMPQLVVAGSVETKRLLEKKKVQDIFFQDDQDISIGLQKLGAVTNPAVPSISLNGLVNKDIHAGEVLDLGGLSMEAIQAPGHCRGGMAFWIPEEKVLFCSDYLGFFLAPDRFVPNFYVDFADYMTTFESLQKLAPRWLCPGHCGVYAEQEARDFVNQSRAEMEWVYDYVVRHSAGSDAPNNLREALFERYYVREGRMFSEQSTRYCMDLIIRRILEAAFKQGDRE